MHWRSFDSDCQLEHFMAPAQLVKRPWKTALLSSGWCWNGFIQPVLIFPTPKWGCPLKKAIMYRRSPQFFAIDCNEEDILLLPGVTVYLVTYTAVLINTWTHIKKDLYSTFPQQRFLYKFQIKWSFLQIEKGLHWIPLFRIQKPTLKVGMDETIRTFWSYWGNIFINNYSS